VTTWGLVVIFVSSFFAGMVNSVAGGGTLLTFPTLVFLGINPIVANATNAVGLWPGSFAGMLGFRKDMVGTRHWIMLLIWPSIAGGAAGAILLLRTPTKVFSEIAPILVLLATFLLAVQDPISRRFGSPGSDHDAPRWTVGAIVGQFLVALYGGFFGAGIGIMMLATLGLLGLTDIHRMNGLKNLFAICINGVAAIYFIVSGAVLWPEALVMALGAVAGGFGGAGIAHRLGRTFVRRLVIAIGIVSSLALAIRLAV
jgi:uncharacterized membrane protein YfcA